MRTRIVRWYPVMNRYAGFSVRFRHPSRESRLSRHPRKCPENTELRATVAIFPSLAHRMKKTPHVSAADWTLRCRRLRTRRRGVGGAPSIGRAQLCAALRSRSYRQGGREDAAELRATVAI